MAAGGMDFVNFAFGYGGGDFGIERLLFGVLRGSAFGYFDWLLGFRLRGRVDKRELFGAGIDENHGDGGHAQRLARLGAGKNHVFHARAAQRLGGLLTEDPTDGVTQVRLAASIRPDHGRDSAPVKFELRAVAEGLESLEFDLFQLQQMTPLY